jgi:hypothetical protein
LEDLAQSNDEKHCSIDLTLRNERFACVHCTLLRTLYSNTGPADAQGMPTISHATAPPDLHVKGAPSKCISRLLAPQLASMLVANVPTDIWLSIEAKKHVYVTNQVVDDKYHTWNKSGG